MDRSRGRLHHNAKGMCALTKMPHPQRELTLLDTVHRGIEDLIRVDHPNISSDALVSRSEIARYRTRYVKNLLKSEKGELNDLELQVARSIAQHETLSENIAAGLQSRRTFGEKLSDGFANFGGSWNHPSFHRRTSGMDCRKRCSGSRAI